VIGHHAYLENLSPQTLLLLSKIFYSRKYKMEGKGLSSPRKRFLAPPMAMYIVLQSRQNHVNRHTDIVVNFIMDIGRVFPI